MEVFPKMSKYRVVITSKVLANRWWGQQWCHNVANYALFPNRLERGRAYIRRGKVHDIMIEQNEGITTVAAKVDGSANEQYDVQVFVKHLPEDVAKRILSKIANLNALKDGFVPDDYKFLFSIEKGGLFPTNNEIGVLCSCPDVAVLCKHVAAVLYAIGSILDQEPLLLFQLRGIDVDSYLDAEIREKTNELLIYAKNFNDEDRLIEDNLISEVIGIDLEELHSAGHEPASRMVQPTAADEKIRTIVIGQAPKARREKASSGAKENPTNVLRPERMVIRQYGLDGTFIAQYDTYDDATEQTGIAKRIMQRNVCGEKKSGGGYVWKREPANTPCDRTAPLTYDSGPQKKPVCQYEYNGILVDEYESISEASQETGISITGIKHALRGLQKQAGGYIWMYKEDGIT